MKRTVPLLITALAGLTLIVAFFIPAVQTAGEEAAIWFDILAAIAFVLGGANLFRLQLQKISDRQAGWGYAAITLIVFVLTLLFGLTKIGCPPETSVEAYAESFAPFPVADLPEYRIPATIPPTRADEAALPKSVREQIGFLETKPEHELTFRGWMTPAQLDDLADYQDTLEWKCQTETLFAATQLPASLTNKLRYDANYHVLAFRGVMTDADRAAILQVLGTSPRTTSAVDELSEKSRRETVMAVTAVPPRFSIPADQQANIQLTDRQLRIRGPMSVELRENLAVHWRNDVRVRPLTAAQQSQLLNEIQQRGIPLNSQQRTVFDNFFQADWKANLLVQALNTAGISEAEKKTACELLSEIQAGTLQPQLQRPAPPPLELNAGQIRQIEAFVQTAGTTPEELRNQLAAAGEFSDAQQAAFTMFFRQLPTQAEHRRQLCFRLLEVGSLEPEQRTFLLQEAREQFQWRQTIGRLFVAAHQVKYPWSGSYDSQGSPFWWLYTYVYEPLLTTTFALLAFYVASAAFRAFRAKNLEAVLLLGTAFIILLGRTSAGPALTGWIPDRFAAFRTDQLTVYIMSIFNTAGNRAIMIGIALGTISTSLKVLLGIDRSYLGRGDE